MSSPTSAPSIPDGDRSFDRETLARALIGAAYVATIAVTAGVWRVRAVPPSLPIVPIPSFDMFVPMIASIVWSVWRPRRGLVVHAGVLAYAIASDELRAQPFFLSLSILLAGTSGVEGLRTLARVHLVALWSWAAIHKALSPAFFHDTSRWLLDAVVPNAPPRARDAIGVSIVLGEISLAVLTCVPRTRRMAAVFAVIVHVAIVFVVSRPSIGRNVALWGWNAGIAVAAIALVSPWRESWRETWVKSRRGIRMLAVAMLLVPAGYRFGHVGPTLGHVLYTGSVATTVWCDETGDCRSDREQHETLPALGVLVPPEPRMLTRYFRTRCVHGERMHLHDPLRDDARRGPSITEITCPR